MVLETVGCGVGGWRKAEHGASQVLSMRPQDKTKMHEACRYRQGSVVVGELMQL